MKTFVRGFWRPNMKSVSVQVSQLKRTWQIKTSWTRGEWRPLWHHIPLNLDDVSQFLASSNKMFLMEDSLLTFPNIVWWMIMFIIVSYLLGWPHKKLTMSLIDLFPSANDVSTGLHVARVLAAIIDSYYLPLMIVLIICCPQEELDNIIWKLCKIFCEPWLTHHPWSGLLVFVTWSWTLDNGDRKEGQWRGWQHRKQVNIWMLFIIFFLHVTFLTYFKLH